MIRFFSKITLSVGAILGIHFLEINKENPPLIRKEEAKLPSITKISAIDDIELFEKMHNCSFKFSEKLEKKEFHKAKDFFQKYSKLEKDIVETANSKKVECVLNKKVVFSLEGGNKLKFQEDWINKSNF